MAAQACSVFAGKPTPNFPERPLEFGPVAALRHTRYGWWLEDAGPVEPTAALSGDVRADVLVVGGGYLGLWTAWHLKTLEPGLEIAILERDLAGHGPSGRNGGFVSTLWDDLPTLRERVGDKRAVAVAEASERAVRGIGTWCEENEVDAWYRVGGTLQVATNRAQLGDWDRLVEACQAVGASDQVEVLDRDAVLARCASPLFLGASLLRLSATVHPARLALGLRDRVLRAGVRIFERSPVTDLDYSGTARTAGGSVTAGAVVLAANAATPTFSGFGRSLATASSHMVITEPVPGLIEELGWTGGEAIHDCRTLLHYLRTTRDGRIAFGWGGGRMGFGGRLADGVEVDAGVAERTRASLLRFFPQLAGRRIELAWGGPIDVSPTHLPIFGTREQTHYGFGFTGNGVGPSYLGGEILARLALDRRDEITGLALVEPDRKLFPPEPLRWLGGAVIRQAILRLDAAADEGRTPDPLSRAVAAMPRLLGLHLPR